MRLARPSLAVLVLLLLGLGLVLWLRPAGNTRDAGRPAIPEPARIEQGVPLVPSEFAVERRGSEDRAPAEPSEEVLEGDRPLVVPRDEFSLPGTIEGLVLRGGGPCGGGEAWRKRNSYRYDESWCAHSGPDEAAERVRIGPDGTFRFLVEPGDHCVGVELGSGQRRTRAFHVTEGEPVRRWVIVLGSSEIRGHAWTEEGQPAADVSIWFSGNRRREGGTFRIDRQRFDAHRPRRELPPHGARRVTGSTGPRTRAGAVRPARWRRAVFAPPAPRGPRCAPRGVPDRVAPAERRLHESSPVSPAR